jgi:hypothetical protein
VEPNNVSISSDSERKQPNCYDFESGTPPERVSAMTNWADLSRQFNDDLKRARIAKERVNLKQRLVENRGTHLWSELVKEVNAAVAFIRSGLLLTGPDPRDNPNEFAVIYNREGDQRKALTAFQPATRVVVVRVIRTDRPWEAKFSITAADDGGLVFTTVNGEYTPAQVVAEMLKRLL